MTAAQLRQESRRRVVTVRRLWEGADCTCAARPGTPQPQHSARCALRYGGAR